MVVLNARDAADRGADVRTRTRVASAVREAGVWALTLVDGGTGSRNTATAGALVNAAGPWVGEVLSTVLRLNTPAAVRLVQGSHVVVPHLYEHGRCYIFQNADGRIFFAIPYETDFTLIGTTDHDYKGDPAEVHATADEVAYICRAASEYFIQPVKPEQVVWSYSGVRPLYDDGAAPVLSVFGGKITTYWRLAEAALARLAPHLPAAKGLAAGWTAQQALPGGNFPPDGYEAEAARLSAGAPFLPPGLARRLVRAYGTLAHDVVGTAASLADMGRDFGAGLTGAELDYLRRREWARTGADVAWRRSKLGLRLTAAEIKALDAALAPQPEPAA